MQDREQLVIDAGAELVGDLALPLDQRPHLVYLASLSTEKGRRSMRSALDVVAEAIAPASARCPSRDFNTPLGVRGRPAVDADAVPWHLLRYQHTQAIRARLVEHYAPATVNKILAALRGVLREARRLGLMSAEDCAAACDLKAARGERLPAGRALEHAELVALLGACDRRTRAGARNAALVSLLYGCGLRRAEVVGLDCEDYVAGDASLKVRGKGGKERKAFIGGAAGALEAWLASRAHVAHPALFLPIDRLDRIAARRLTDQAVLDILQRLAAVAGVERFSPHDVRRTFITQLLDRGADPITVQRMAGHAQVTTTQKYDRRGEDVQRRAAELLRLK
ncbi:tyrosine-type recombinase/integrase [Sorangium sp. So ce375]|uniref:tyrosine-type recombinase/integrase n=1 Tax=Sorangium sp. So ce375 TaxID=3133306 RepID=UPI003F5BB7DC